MIGRIKGILIEKIPPFILLDCQGVGYEIEVPMTTFFDLPDEGSEVSLLTHLVVREDAHLLFGFANPKAIYLGLMFFFVLSIYIYIYSFRFLYFVF